MQLEAKSTALVLIDLQKGVMAMPVAPHPATSVPCAWRSASARPAPR
jgi:hypothetical protein